MSEELDNVIADLQAGGESPAYLLWGEEFLVRKAAEALLAALVPGAMAGLNLVTLDGATPREIAAELATLPMFPGRKVVFVRDPEFLAPKKGRPDALGKARDAWKANRRKEAARRVLAIAARAGWGVGELDPSAGGAPKADDWERELGISLAQVDLDFLQEVATFCRAEGLTGSSGDDNALVELLERGPARGQVLVIAASELDPKAPLIKLIKDKGTVIEKKVTAQLKELDLSAFTVEVLAPFKKKLAPGAAEKLKDRLGGNMRLVQSELQKLALHAQGDVITVKDIELLVGHAREEEFLELSDALQKRDLEGAMKYVAEALAQGAAELQLLGAITSITRTLLNNHERMVALCGGKPPRNYNDFKAKVFPRIEAEAKERKARVPHPYASFMGMQSAAAFGRAALLQTLTSCAEADLALKLGGDVLVLERLLLTLTGRATPWDSGMTTIRRENER